MGVLLVVCGGLNGDAYLAPIVECHEYSTIYRRIPLVEFGVPSVAPMSPTTVGGSREKKSCFAGLSLIREWRAALAERRKGEMASRH